MVGKQFSPFMELLGQLCLTTWATMSYYLGNYVLLLGQLCLTTWATVSYYLGNYVLLLGQLCLTTWATMSYYLGNCVLLLGQLCLTTWATVSYCSWKWLAGSFAIYGNGFRGCTSENQRLHKELSNSKNRVTYRIR
jgi:hypothetical protein